MRRILKITITLIFAHLLLLGILAYFVYADVDTKDAVTISTSASFDGCSGIGVCSGQTIASAGCDTISMDNSDSGNIATGTSFSDSHSLGVASGNNRMVLLLAGSEGSGAPDPTYASYDGVNGTEAFSVAHTGGWNRLVGYYWLDADLPASTGSYTYEMNYGSTVYAGYYLMSLTNVDQSAPGSATSSEDTSTTSISTQGPSVSNSGSWYIDCVDSGEDTNWTTASGQTERIEFDLGGTMSTAFGTEVVSSQETNQWNSSASVNRLLQTILMIEPSNCPAGAVHDCSGDQSWGWSAENTTITSGDPAGCADGQATSASASGSAELSTTQNSDGTYAVHIPGGQDYYSISNFDSDEFDYNEGKLEFDVYIDTFVQYPLLFEISYDSSNRLRVYLDGAAADIDIMARWDGGGSTDYTGVADSGNFAEDEWLHVVVQWKLSESSADWDITVSDLNISTRELTNTTSAGASDDLASWAADADSCLPGNFNTYNGEFYLDRIKIFKTSGL
jgi:hypothetical protein